MAIIIINIVTDSLPDLRDSILERAFRIGSGIIILDTTQKTMLEVNYVYFFDNILKKRLEALRCFSDEEVLAPNERSTNSERGEVRWRGVILMFLRCFTVFIV